MRVAHVGNVPQGTPNGVHAVIGRLCELLPSVGVTPEVWHPTRSVDRVTQRVVGETEIFDLPVLAAPGRAGSHLQVPTSETRRWVEHRRSSIDVLHLHSVFQPDHVWTAHGGTPYVLTPHGGYHERVLTGRARLAKRLWLSAHDARLVRLASAVQALTTSEARDIARLSPGARTVVLEAPLPTSSTAPTRSAYADQGPAVFIGRLDLDHKGLDLLLKGFADSSAARDRRLVLAGPAHGDSPAALGALASRLGLDARLEVRGPVTGSAKESLLSSASVFIHTSRREGLPLGPLEAMSHGLPVLVSRETNLGEMVDFSGAGVVVDADSGSIARGLDTFFDASSSERARWGINARTAVEHRFSWARLGPEYRGFYARAAS